MYNCALSGAQDCAVLVPGHLVGTEFLLGSKAHHAQNPLKILSASQSVVWGHAKPELTTLSAIYGRLCMNWMSLIELKAMQTRESETVTAVLHRPTRTGQCMCMCSPTAERPCQRQSNAETRAAPKCTHLVPRHFHLPSLAPHSILFSMHPSTLGLSHLRCSRSGCSNNVSRQDVPRIGSLTTW